MSAINAMVVIGNDEIPADARRAIFSSRYDGKPDPWEDEESSDSNDDMSDYVSVIYAYSIPGILYGACHGEGLLHGSEEG